MMQRPLNKVTVTRRAILAGFGASLLLSVISPILLYARVDTAPSDQAAQFCGRLSNIGSTIAKGVERRVTALEGTRAEQLTLLDERRARRDEARNERIENRSTRVDELHTRLESRIEEAGGALTAVTDFKTTIDGLIAQRESAVSDALAEYRQGLNDARDAHRTSIDGGIETFRSAIDAALGQAQTDCEAGVSPATLRQTLKDGLGAAREAYQQEIRAVAPETGARRALNEEFRATVRTATEEFKSGIHTARDALKAEVAPE